MTVPPIIAPAAAATAADPPVEISDREIAHLRNAAGWARFIAVAGFVLGGLFVLGSVALILTNASSEFSNAIFSVSLAISVIGSVGACALLFGYGRKVQSFFSHGEPALAQGFRRLRLFLVLWTLLGVLGIAFDVLAIFGKL